MEPGDQALLRAVVDATPDPAFVKDRELRLLLANPAMLSLLGKARADEALGRTPLELAPPERAAATVASDRAVLESGAPSVVEETVPTPEGERFLAWTRTPLRDAGGLVVGLVGISRDVTERKQTEDELRRALDRTVWLARLPEESTDPVLRLSLDGRLLYANASAFVGFHELRLVPNAAVPVGLAEPARRAVAEGRGVQAEIALGARVFSVTFSPMGTEVAVYGQDITPRKRAEEAQESLLAALRESDERKTQFLAMLSHELRNPLAPIRNSLYLLERTSPGGEQARRALTVIDRQVAHVTRLVDDLLDVTRISRGKIELKSAPVELGALVRKTAEDHRTLFARSGVALTLSAERAVWVDGDATRLAQVVGNVLQNAAKFTPRGGHAWVSVAEEHCGREALVAVRDDGAGIVADVLGRLFEPFVQADRTLDRSRGGLGLGLSLVKGLVELHGGRVEARSEGAGRGTEFRIWLPVVPAPVEVEGARASRPQVRRRVLVIEDNVDAAESLREALELDEHEVEVAFDGPAGVEKARRFRPEAVLCDIGLPGMDGYEVARAFRSDPELRSAFLVALTGYALPEDRAKAHAAGFDRHLAKPPDLERLERVLATFDRTPAGDHGP